MFKPYTDRIAKLAEKYPAKIAALEKIFANKTNLYIDQANLYFSQNKLGFHIDYKRLAHLLKSFDTVNSFKIYLGVVAGDTESEQLPVDLRRYGFETITKPVKKMHLSIDTSSISESDPELLKCFIDKALLGELDINTVKFLNGKLKELNDKGQYSIEHWKCNFDVEMGSDMLIDNINDSSISTFVIASGDSDFAFPVEKLISLEKRTSIFATARKVSPELASTGSYIFDWKDIREFICWPREMKSGI